MPDDEEADYIRNLVPVANEEFTKPCIVDEFGGMMMTNYDPQMEIVVYEDVLYNWFAQEGQINSCLKDDREFIAYMISDGDYYCDKVMSWMEFMLED